jgi:tetratricopeptide (TPR) repeat protein
MWGDDRYIRDHIDTIGFVGGAVAIHKRKSRDVAPALAFMDQYLQSVDKSPAQLFRLAEYILRHGGPVDHAERLVDDAVSLAGPSAQTYGWRVDILCRLGRPEEATEVAAEATRLWPDNHGVWNWLSHVEQRLGRTGAAIATLERAIAIYPNEVHYLDRLGHLLQQQGEPARALLSAKKAASLHPDHQPLQQRVADLERLTAAVSE